MANYPIYPVATTLNGAINGAVVALVVASATGFPPVPFVVTIDTEQIGVTVAAGVNWTITRAANGTTAAAHANGAAVNVVVPADNATLGPPPVATSILNQTPDDFGVPHLQRGNLSGAVTMAWSSWFSGAWQRIIRAALGYQSATILSGAINGAVVALAVNSSTGFPSAPFVAAIDSEQIIVTAVAGVNWTITRAANGTGAAAHADKAPVTLKPIITPGRLVKVEADGQVDESAIATTDVVLGAASLVTVGNIPKVTATGTLGPSAISDDGAAVVAFTGRIIALDNNQDYAIKDSAGTAKLVLLLDNANPDVLHLRNNQRAAGGTISFETLAAGGVGATLDNAGNLNVVGIFKIAGVPGESTTLTYGSSLGGVIPAGLTLNTKTVTFTGGIETGHT